MKRTKPQPLNLRTLAAACPDSPMGRELAARDEAALVERCAVAAWDTHFIGCKHDPRHNPWLELPELTRCHWRSIARAVLAAAGGKT